MSARVYLSASFVFSFALIGCSKTPNTANDFAVQSATPVVFNTAGAPTVEFNAPDMMCPEGCGEKVKEILSEQPGAKEVLIDFDAKVAKVAVADDSKFDKDAAVAALVDHGFKNSTVKSEADVAKPEAATVQ